MVTLLLGVKFSVLIEDYDGVFGFVDVLEACVECSCFISRKLLVCEVSTCNNSLVIDVDI